MTELVWPWEIYQVCMTVGMLEQIPCLRSAVLYGVREQAAIWFSVFVVGGVLGVLLAVLAMSLPALFLPMDRG